MRAVHLKDVDLNLLVALGQLLDSRSVTAAAAALDLSQPAMSRVLGRLRRTFGDPLFVRTAHGLAPTPRAEELRGRLDDVLGRLEAVVAPPLRFEPARAERTFVIASADYGQVVLLPLVLAKVAVEAPGVSLRVVAAPEPWTEPLARGELDLCWSPRRHQASDAQMVWNRLFLEDFQFVVRAGHPRAGPRLTLERFVGIPQLALAPGGKPGNPLDDALARLGTRRRVVAHVPSFLTVPELVADSELGAVLPRRLVQRVRHRYGLDVFELPFEVRGFDISQAWHERMRHDPAHAWLRTLVRAVARESLQSPGGDVTET